MKSIFLILLHLHYGVTAQYSSSIIGNLSAHGPISSVVTSPAVTASASSTQSGDQLAGCNPCQIVAAWESISRVYWYNSSIGITLDTISVVVTKYNDTAITSSSTVYGDLHSVDPSTVAEAQSIVSAFSQAAGDIDYNLQVGVLLGNATEGGINASNAITYSRPYVAIDEFQYVSLSYQIDGCPLGERRSPGSTCNCIMQSLAGMWVVNGWVDDPFTVSSVSLTSTYYQALDADVTSNDIGNISSDFGPLSTASFLDFLSSASAFKSYPGLSSCAVFWEYNGPPAVQIPAFALTATVATTVAGHGQYNPPTPQPSSPVVPAPIASKTAAGSSAVQTGQAASVPVSNLGPSPPPNPPEASPTPLSIPANLGSPPAGKIPATVGQQSPSQRLKPVLTFGGSTYTADESSKIILPSQTLVPGSPAAVVANTPISIAPGGLAAIVGTSTQLLATLSSPAALTLGGSSYTADLSSNIVLAGFTLKAGGTPVVISGTTVSLAPGGAAAVVGTSTQILGSLTPTLGSSNTFQEAPKPIPAAPVLTYGGSTYTANAATQFIVAGQTVAPGGVIEVSGTPISIAPGASLAIIGSSTQSLIGSAITPQPVLTFAGSAYTAGSSSDFVIKGQTLTKGGTINVDGTQLSFGQAGTDVVIGASTQQLSASGITAIAEPVFTFDGSTYTAGPLSGFVIDGKTLTKGGTINVDGTQLSFGQAGTDVVIGTSTQQLSSPGVTTIAEPVFTFDGSVYTADPSSDFVIDGHTLSRGGVIDVDGTRISYGQGGTDIVIGTSTQDLGTASITLVEEPAITLDGSTYYADSASEFVINGQTYAATGTDVVIGTRTEAVGLGGYIMSGFGSGPSSTLPVAFTGKAGRKTPAAGVLCLISAGLALYMAG